jgi:hypothetical protein
MYWLFDNHKVISICKVAGNFTHNLYCFLNFNHTRFNHIKVLVLMTVERFMYVKLRFPNQGLLDNFDYVYKAYYLDTKLKGCVTDS